MIIAIDFDGTCVTHEFPKIGEEIGATPILKKITDAGNGLILFTMRSDGQDSGNVLAEAINWFEERNIPLFGIQYNPQQLAWTTSPKAYAELYIDDAGIGCPLLFDLKISKRPFVDWIKVEKYLIENNII